MKIFENQINEVGYNILSIQQKQSSCANIFFHGYTAVTSEEDIKELKQCVPIIDNQDCLFVHWDSGNIKQTVSDIFSDVVKKLPSKKPSSFKEKIFSRAKDLAITATKEMLVDFIVAQKKSDALALNLAAILDNCESSHSYDNINLIGHSLGARIVLQAICSLPEDYRTKIRNVVLMGAAIGWQKEFEQGLKNITNLRLFNLYSTNDLALLGKPRLARCIGRSIIPESPQYRIFNIHCEGFGHTDYWPQFMHLNEAHNLLDIN